VFWALSINYAVLSLDTRQLHSCHHLASLITIFPSSAMTGIRRLAATFAIFSVTFCSAAHAADHVDLQQVFQDHHGVDVKIAPQGPSLKDVL
jgi:hypothetical protein